ncbi:hypothetical protein F4808DRAFT_474754 [Astrocystis sublimbata]|nr:hypothetical protein F4808DRAFT_474754 [Astrocystis sublimbata]
MPSKGRAAAQRAAKSPFDFASLMQKMRQKLLAEEQVQEKELTREVARQFSIAKDELFHRRRLISLCCFGWLVYEGVMNRFSPSSLSRGDKPSQIQEKCRPFLRKHVFGTVDIYAMSFDQIVDFVHRGGNTDFPWPKKHKTQMIVERNARKVRHLVGIPNEPSVNNFKSVIISPSGSTLPYPTGRFSIMNRKDCPRELSLLFPSPQLATQSADESQLLPPIPSTQTSDIAIPHTSSGGDESTSTSINTQTYVIRDKDIHSTTTSLPAKPYTASPTKPQVPETSVICESIWDWNNKANSVPSAGMQEIDTAVHNSTINIQSSSLPAPSLGTTKPSQMEDGDRDVDEFMMDFLGEDYEHIEYASSEEDLLEYPSRAGQILDYHE